MSFSDKAGDIFYIVRADYKTEFSKDLDGAQKKAQTAGSNIGNAMKKVAGVLAALGIASVVKDIIDLGNQSQIVSNKFGTVFNPVLAQASANVKDLADNFNFSDLAAKKTLSSVGDLLTGIGFTADSALNLGTEVAKLSAELGAFNGYSAEAVSEDLTKALLGETEAAKKYGLVLNQVVIDQKIAQQATEGMTFATDAQAKASAVLALALEQSKNAINGFADMQETAAYRMKSLQNEIQNYGVEIGEQLLPAVSDVALILTENLPKLKASFDPFIPALTKMIDMFGEGVKFVGNILDLARPLTDLVANILGGLLDIASVPLKTFNEAIEGSRVWNERLEKSKNILRESVAELEKMSEQEIDLGNVTGLVTDNLTAAFYSGQDMVEQVKKIAEQTGLSESALAEYAYSLDLISVDEASVLSLKIKQLETDRQIAETKQFEAAMQGMILYYSLGSQQASAKVAADIKTTSTGLIGVDKTYADITAKMETERAIRAETLRLLGLENDAIAIRDEMQAKINELVSGLSQLKAEGAKTDAVGIQKLETELELLQTQIVLQNEIVDGEKIAADAKEAALQKEIALTEKLDQLNEQLGETLQNTVLSAYRDIFSAIGESMNTGVSGWKAYAKIALEALGSILKSLGDYLAAKAVLSFPDVAAMLAYGGGAAAAYIGAGWITSEAQKYAATGASFIVPPGYENDSYKVAVSSGEQVNIGKPGGGGGLAPGNYDIILNIGTPGLTGAVLQIVERGSRNGSLNMSKKGIS